MDKISPDMIKAVHLIAYEETGITRIKQLIQSFEDGKEIILLGSDELDSIDGTEWIKIIAAIVAGFRVLLDLFNTWSSFSSSRNECLSDEDMITKIRGHMSYEQNRVLSDKDIYEIIKVAENCGKETP